MVMRRKAADPLDKGPPTQKAWHEFEASFSGAFLNVWLLREAGEINPEYLEDLRRRLGEAIVTGQMWSDDPPEWLDEWDGYEPLQGPFDQHGFGFIPLEEAELLEAQLFPHGSTEADFWWLARGFATIGLYSALETYCRALDIVAARRGLPAAINAFLTTRLLWQNC